MARPRTSERVWTEHRQAVSIGKWNLSVQSITITPERLHPIHGRQIGPARRVALTSTRPHFGGRRWWFVCPECERRCGKLYWDEDLNLKCRVCLRLVFRSQYRQSWLARTLRSWRRSAERGLLRELPP